MKKSNIIFNAVLMLLIVALLPATALKAQETKQDDPKAAEVRALLESKNFAFTAQSVTPQRGGMRQLTSQYDLKVSSESVEAYLPYFGRVYTAPINPSEAGIQFKATNFDYNIKETKKRGWDVVIKPKDTDVKQLLLSVSKNGYATLQVVSNSKQPISYQGYIGESKKTK